MGPDTETARCADPHLPQVGSGYVNGVRLDPVTADDLFAAVGAFVACGRSHVVHFCAAHPTVLARDDPSYRALLNRGDINVPDGMAVAWALRAFGHQASRLAGADAMALLASRGVASGHRHYLFGGTAETVTRLRANLETASPGIRVVGAESPPFRQLTPEEWQAAADRIRAAGTDLLWVGLGAPKQDLAGERLRELSAAPAILCVGAAFDFLSGARPRAPRWVQRSGLEWAHRLARDPRRLWRRYLIGNARFVAGVLRDYFDERRATRKSAAPAGSVLRNEDSRRP